MKLLFGVVLLAVSPLAAQQGGNYTMTPEQHPGQLAQLRLRILYPVLAPETAHALAADPAERLDELLADSGPVLKNAGGLAAYLREGLRDPRATEGSEQWKEAWRLLDEEILRLRRIAAQGESLTNEPAPARSEDKPEFDSPDGLRLHGAEVVIVNMENLRKNLMRMSAEAAAKRVGAVSYETLESFVVFRESGIPLPNFERRPPGKW